MCSEMGISYSDMLSLSWAEYAYYLRGYNRKLERGWDYTRHMIANMYNSSGFAKKKVNAGEIMQLVSIDYVPKTVVKEKVDVLRILRNGIPK